MSDGTEKNLAAPPSRSLLRWLKFIPNGLTLCNSLGGYTAILVTLQAYKHVDDQHAMATIFAASSMTRTSFASASSSPSSTCI